MFLLKRSLALATFTVLLPVAFAVAHGETQAQKGSKTFLRMAPLEKITVGPYDNFQGILTSDGKKLLLSKSSNLATHVQVVDMTSVASRGHSKSLVGEVFDTRDPAPSPNGSKVAYTSFERNARGQICVSPIAGDSRDCLPTGKNGARQPQWLSDEVVAYLESSDDGETESLVSLNIVTREKQVFFSDNVLSFSFHPSGKFVVYTVAVSKNGGVPAVRWRELGASGDAKDLLFELPGMTGFPRFDLSGDFLYFSQFFNDTNTDGVIDGDDNSVPFRVAWNAVRNARNSVVPEQLISAEYNCGYPSTSAAHVYVTCNFEDSLDIYRMPLAGVVPAGWSEEQILSAHAAARTVDERVLLLNTLRFRFPAKYDTAQIVERLLASHVVASEYDAAVYYTNVLAKRDPTLAPKLDTLSVIMDVRNRSLQEKSAVPSPAFISYVETVREKMRTKAANEFSALAEVAFDTVLGKPEVALSYWRGINASALKSPLAVFVYGDLGKRILGTGAQAEDARYDLERRLALHPALSEESQVFHALAYMRMLGVRERLPKARLAKLKTLAAGVPGGSVLETFLKAEEYAMELALADTPKVEAELFTKIAKLLFSVKPRYYLKRGLYVRLLVQFSSFNKEQAVNMIASGWVSETKKSDAEYVYAREQYLITQLDKAYQYNANNNLAFSGDVFYGSIRVTDDAEAHVGYVDARLRGGRSGEIDKEYAELEKGGFVAENVQLAQAWRKLQGSDASVLKDSIKLLEQVIEAEGYNPSVAWFLLGYAHHRVAIQSQHKLEFDRNAVESAHHAYMVALDLSRGNKRLLAPLYANLGHLHSIAHNYGQAAAFYAQRLKLPFVSKDERVATLWNAARLAYAGNNAPLALQYMEEALSVLPETTYAKHRRAYLERAAFYALDALNWEKSTQHYAEYFASPGVSNARNDLKARSNQAWALLKSGKKDEAAVAARAVVNTYAAVANDAKDSPSLVPFRADRYAAQALAVLAEIEPDVGRAVELRTHRLAILESWQNDLDGYSLRKGDWRSFVLRELQHIASLQTAAGVSNPMAHWEKCVDGLQKYYDVKSDASDPALFHVLLNTLVVAADRKAPVSPSLRTKLDEIVPAYIGRLNQVASGSSVLVTRWLRMSLLWNAYLVQQQRMSPNQEQLGRSTLLASPFIKDILDTDPTILATLPGRAKITETPVVN